jgi:hypothetical protein
LILIVTFPSNDAGGESKTTEKTPPKLLVPETVASEEAKRPETFTALKLPADTIFKK